MGSFYVEIEGLSSRELFLISVLITRKFRRVQQREQVIKKNKHFFPVSPIAAVREYLQPISFLNSLERKLCNIAFPLSSV